jgi:transcriptional regulator of acetoin/glycerol metabolism
VADPPPATHGGPAPGELEEERRIRQTLERFRWNRMDAARALGMSRTTLWRRMRELHID